MKQKLSVSLNKATLDVVDALIRNGTFRNKSHVVEIAIGKLVKGNFQNEIYSKKQIKIL